MASHTRPEPRSFTATAGTAVLLDLKELSLRGGDHFEQVFALEVAPITLGGSRHQVLVPDGVTVGVDRVAGGYLVNVSADAKIYGPCARCLKEVVLTVHAEQQEFAPTAKDGWQETELSPFIQDLVLDVSGLVREAIVLAVPAQVVCAPDCKGLCPECGQDLNAGRCECATDEPDERWAKLRDMRFDDDAGS